MGIVNSHSFACCLEIENWDKITMKFKHIHTHKKAAQTLCIHIKWADITIHQLNRYLLFPAVLFLYKLRCIFGHLRTNQVVLVQYFLNKSCSTCSGELRTD